MILTCPECTARFAVPDALIPAEGRTVKCGRCAHQWHADGPIPIEPTGDDTAEEALDFAGRLAKIQAEQATGDAPETQQQLPPVSPRQLPVRQKAPASPVPYIAGALALTLVWAVASFLVYYPSWMQTPGLRGIYGSFGVHSSEGLVFEDVSMQRNTMEGGQTQFLISGSITNHAAETRIVPTVRVQLKNAEGKAVWERAYPVNEALEPGKPYAFRIDNVTTSFADHVATIVLDVGHSLQLMMR